MTAIESVSIALQMSKSLTLLLCYFSFSVKLILPLKFHTQFFVQRHFPTYLLERAEEYSQGNTIHIYMCIYIYIYIEILYISHQMTVQR